MSDDSIWIERAQSAEAKLATQRQAHEAAAERIKNFKANFGVREKSNGEIVIDFEKMVDRLGLEACLDLRRVIDERWNISGAPGEKPRIKVRSA